ncbi:hypothetical protein ABFY60_10025 [Lysinibacillus pakistanensis]|uniref:hypothetical protein n=1 Tax=Lysinibacillus pakistanensis TaxID=759811 RepID=UPI003D2A6D5C
MKKPFKKTWMMASALTLGLAVLTPLQAGATSVQTPNNATVQMEQQITGTITDNYGDGINLKGKDGKNYFISFYKFSKEQLEKLNLTEGQEISVEGSIVNSYSDFYTFEVYKRDLPKEVTAEELAKLEKLFNEMKRLEKEASVLEDTSIEAAEKKYDEIAKIYEDMYKITKPYILASWEPQSFDEYLQDFGFSENNIVIDTEDKKQLKVIYDEWVKLAKAGIEEDKADEKYEAFYTILQPYLDKLYPPQTFEEYMADTELSIPAETLAKLKTIYDDAQRAEKDKNDELSEKLWTEFYSMMDDFYTPQTFEEYMADFAFEVSEADKKQLKALYEEILAFDKKVEQEKIDAKWDAFYTILDPYFKANKEILISASKLTLNGQVYLPQ